MTETVTVRMTRGDNNTPWGFRLQGGKDYGYPLTIGRVATGSLADRAGLKENDHVHQIAGRNVENTRHGDAQDSILGAGNMLDLIITRGASRIWAPSITSAEFPEIDSAPVKYSLSHDYSKDTQSNIGSGHNVQPKPFGTSYSSTTNTKSTKTYQQQQNQNSPSFRGQHSPADAYLQQTGGLFGTDPKVNQPPRDEPSYLKSKTLELIQQNEHNRGSTTPTYQPQSSPRGAPGEAPIVPGAPVCDNCGRSILGVFCKAGGKTLHGECFKCATCGNSLKNVGYFLVNEKLYCDVHARQVKDTYQPSVLQVPGGQTRSLSPRDTHQGGNTYKSTYTSSHTTSNVGGGGGPPPTSAPFSNNYNSYSPGAGAGAAPGSKFGGAGSTGQFAGPRAQPRRGRGILKHLHDGPRIPVCEACRKEIRGPFVLALSKTWCPDHFVCNTSQCRRPLIDIGFLEDGGSIHCEHCYEKYYAPTCSKCQRKVIGECLTALQKQFHPDCFTCTHCHKPFGNSSFFLENGQPFCEADWNNLFTTKCASCEFPIEAGDRWVEALGNAYHSNCFNCNVCQKTLEGQNFYSKGGRPYCKAHA